MPNNPACSIHDAFGVKNGNLYIGRTQIGWVPIGQPVILSNAQITHVDGVAVTPGATFSWFEAAGTRTLVVAQIPDPDDGNTIKNAVYIDWEIQLSLVSSLESVYQVEFTLNGTICMLCVYMPEAFIPEDKSVIYGGAFNGDLVLVDLETEAGSVIVPLNSTLDGVAFGSVQFMFVDVENEHIYISDGDQDFVRTDLSGGNPEALADVVGAFQGNCCVVDGFGLAIRTTDHTISRYNTSTDAWEHAWVDPGFDSLKGIYPDLGNGQFIAYGETAGNGRMKRYDIDGTQVASYFAGAAIGDIISGVCLPSESDDGRFHISTFTSEIYSCANDGTDVQLEAATAQDFDAGAYWAWNRQKVYWWDFSTLKSLDLPSYDNVQTIYTIPTAGNGVRGDAII